jgi:hypothetical protein
VGLNRKIQAQCQSSPPVKASPSDISDTAKLSGSVVNKKNDRLSSQLDQKKEVQANYYEQNGAHSQPQRNRKTLVELSARRSSYDDYEERLDETNSERELRFESDSGLNRAKATAL